jgi:hypothetical protein
MAPLEDGISSCVTDDGTPLRQMEHVLPPLSYAVEAGYSCDIIMSTNGDNVYAADMWSQVLIGATLVLLLPLFSFASSFRQFTKALRNLSFSYF